MSRWGLVPQDKALEAGREQFALSLVGGVTPQPGVLAGLQEMFRDGSSKIYRISLQKLKCLRSNQDLPFTVLMLLKLVAMLAGLCLSDVFL